MYAIRSYYAWDGLRRTRDTHELRGYCLASRSIPWWAAGLSVRATQLRAITMVGTTAPQRLNDIPYSQGILSASPDGTCLTYCTDDNTDGDGAE